MDPSRVGAAFRALRLRAVRTQAEVATRAGVSRASISRIERGQIGGLSVGALQSAARALDARVEVDVRWRGTALDRLLDARHAALQQRVVRTLRETGWTCVPEASFSVYGERGSIDVLAFHPSSRSVLVVEIKSELVDCQDLLRTMDQRRRLAPVLARERGWSAAAVSAWVALEARDVNRRRVRAHAQLFRAAFPLGGAALRRWLQAPAGAIAALTFVAYAPLESSPPRVIPLERVRRPTAERARTATSRALAATGDSDGSNRSQVFT